MNKTVTVNLGGSIFNIEDEAFHLLKNYLDRIKANFTGDPGESEIMHDIEVRIAELFQERLDERKNVVIRKDVEEVIGVMGQPEDFDIGAGKSNQQESGTLRNQNRRLYRDKDDAVLGGVCSGFGHYLGWDPVILRVLFVIFGFASFGTAFLVYIIFWAVTPAAESTAEKLQMRGEPVNVENISRFVRDEAKTAGDNMNRWSNKAGREMADAAKPALNVLGTVFAKIVGFILFCFGFGLLIGMFAMLFAAEFSFFGSDFTTDQINQLLFHNNGTVWMLSLGIILVMAAPAIALIYAGIRLLVGTTRRIRGLGWSLAALFTIGVIMLFISGVNIAGEFKADSHLKSEMVLDSLVGDTLYVDALEDVHFPGRHHREGEFFDLLVLGTDSIVCGEPIYLGFEESRDDQFSIVTERCCHGPNLRAAGEMASRIQYPYYADGNRLMLGSALRFPATDKYRGQSVEITVYVPEGKYVHFGKNIGLISWHHVHSGQALRLIDGDWEDQREEHRIEMDDSSVRIYEDSIIVKSGDVEVHRLTTE